MAKNKKKWVSPMLGVLDFEFTLGSGKRWQGPAFEGSGRRVHESAGFFHRATGGKISKVRTASSTNTRRRARYGPS